MDEFLYQSAKLTILNNLHVSKDAMHIHIGLIVFSYNTR